MCRNRHLLLLEGSQIRKTNMFENVDFKERIGKNAILMHFHAIIRDTRSSGELKNILKCPSNEIFYFSLRKSIKNLEDCYLPFFNILFSSRVTKL